MILFGIDTCCMAATAALLDDTRLLAQTVVNHKQTHSQKLMPQIEAMFSACDLTAADIDCFAAAVGPGSFTGVRIGVATAKAMAQAYRKPCVAISTLHALANNNALFDGIICPIQDARRNQVYNALFRGGDSLTRLCGDRALALSDLLDELKQTDAPVLFCGDGTFSFRDQIEVALGIRARFAQRMQNMNLAASVAELGYAEFLAERTVSYEDLAPQYLRLSQAERERMEKLQKEVQQ